MTAPLRALCAATLLCMAPAAQAQPPAPAAVIGLDSVAWLQGDWRGTGTMFGRPSEARLEIRPALGGRFLELSYRASGFEGRAFFRPAGEGRWTATWFDNRGVSFPIVGTVAERTLTAEWGSAETERGRTIYRLLPDGRLEVTDTAGGRDFARHMLARQ